MYINGREADIGNSEAVFSFAINTIGEVSSRSGTFSNEFTLPLTANNIEIIGAFQAVSSASNIPYTAAPFEIRYYDNVCIVGTAELVEVNEDGIVIRAYSDNAEWSSQIKGLGIKDIDTTTPVPCIRVPWSAPIYRSNDWTRGFIWPNANFGYLDNTMPPNQVINLTWVYPVWYLKFILQCIFNHIGYTPTGEAWNDPQLNNIVISGAKKTALANAVDYNQLYRAEVATAGEFPTPLNSVNIPVPLSVEISDPSNTFNPATYTYTSPNQMIVTVQVAIRFNPTDWAAYSAVGAVFIMKNGVGVESIAINTLYGTPPDWAAEFDIQCAQGDTLSLEIGFAGTVGASMRCEMDVNFLPQNTYQDGQEIQIGGVFDKWKALDFVALWFNTQGVSYTTNNLTKEINFFFTDSIMERKTQAVNLTNKIDHTTPPTIQPIFGEFGIKNILQYALDEEDPYLNLYRGRGEISCINNTREAEVVVYESKAALFVRKSFLSGSAELAVIPYTEDIVERVGVIFPDNNRLIFDDGGAGTNPAVQYGMRCDTIDFSVIIPQRYKMLTAILARPKQISYLTKLNYTDLRDFKWDYPVYIEGAGCAYVPSITDVSLDESTKPLLTIIPI